MAGMWALPGLGVLCAAAAVAGGAVAAGAPTSAPSPPPAVDPGPGARAPGPPGPVRYAAPVSPLSPVRGFEPPPTPYAAGHRGVDLAVAPGQAVTAAADGTVTFAGAVAGRGVVVISSGDGVRTEYEPVRPAARAGDRVARRDPIGVVEGSHGDCAPSTCLHWGARREGAYFDPLTLLAPLGPVRLLPWRDAQARGCACRYTARSRSTDTWV
ncbi:MAG: M23 family metallopeptidase [Jatrophihabitans sp.]|nr:MAG: M23 family metallopeptidase [Jatrophihabitans sp.]